MFTLTTTPQRVKPGRLVRFPACLLALYPVDEAPLTAVLVELAARAACYRGLHNVVGDLVAAELAGVVAEVRSHATPGRPLGVAEFLDRQEGGAR
jgi:hypothetical protein